MFNGRFYSGQLLDEGAGGGQAHLVGQDLIEQLALVQCAWETVDDPALSSQYCTWSADGSWRPHLPA